MNKAISIIVTCHNKDFLIGKVIEAIFENTLSPFELVVVLDGCTDNSEAEVDKVLESPVSNLSTFKKLYADDVFETKANNIGMKQADGDLFILVQDDMVVNEKGWEQRLIQPILTFDDVISVTAKQAHDIGIEKEATWYRSPRLNCPNLASRQTGLSRNVFAVRDTANRGPLAIDAQKIKILNYLDEDYAPYTWDEHDLHLRAYKNHQWVAGCYWIDFISEEKWGSTRTKSGNIFSKAEKANMKKIYQRHGKYLKENNHSHDRNLDF